MAWESVLSSSHTCPGMEHGSGLVSRAFTSFWHRIAHFHAIIWMFLANLICVEFGGRLVLYPFPLMLEISSYLP